MARGDEGRQQPRDVWYGEYKKKIAPLCPVAVKAGQHNVAAPGHNNWGVVTCSCGEQFHIGCNMIYGSRITDKEAVKRLEALLLEDHVAGRQHQDAYEIQD